MTIQNYHKNSSIFVAGHNGMVGSAVVSELKKQGYNNIHIRSKEEVDLRKENEVNLLFENLNFDIVILCAAKVGGILANNNFKADFIYDNIKIGANVVQACHKFKIKKLINLGSSCIYPKEAQIPIKEESLLTGLLEPTNEPYAIAKIAILKMCQSFYDQHQNNFYSLMPCNLYGPGDNFDLKSSHVLPALINKVHKAISEKKQNITLWGTGSPLREFLYSKDVAKAIVFCMENVEAKDIYNQGISHLNCGSNEEVTILNLLLKIKKILNYNGEIIFDKDKPDGTYRKKMDNTRLCDLGFLPQTPLNKGIAETYSWFLKNL